MSTRIVATLQQRLAELGYYHGKIDNIEGPATFEAVVDYKETNGLRARAYVGPITIADMFSDDAIEAPTSAEIKAAIRDDDENMPPWVAEMHDYMGLHERLDNNALARWLRSFGKYLGDPAELPWCGDAVESAIRAALPDEPVPSNPFFAQNWKDFGIDVRDPIVGSIGVIRWSANAGHVGFVVGYDRAQQRVHLLGGNQSNEINITSFPRSKFIAFRWPESYVVSHYPPLRADAVKPSRGYATTR